MVVVHTRLARNVADACDAVGGLLLVLGYWMPWITYHAEGGYLNVTLSGWQAVIGSEGPHQILNSIASDGALLPGLVGVLLLLVACWPFAVGLVAAYWGARSLGSSDGRLRAGRTTWTWVVVGMGVLALLFLIYTLDPFGLDANTYWVVAHDPAPTIGPGSYAICAGMAAVVLGRLIGREPH